MKEGNVDSIHHAGGYETIALRRVYREGYKARCAGRAIDPNPYTTDVIYAISFSDVWEHGWRDADREMKQGR